MEKYPHGVMEEKLATGEQLPIGFALQHPQDYMDGLVAVITDVMKRLKSICFLSLKSS